MSMEMPIFIDENRWIMGDDCPLWRSGATAKALCHKLSIPKRRNIELKTREEYLNRAVLNQHHTVLVIG